MNEMILNAILAILGVLAYFYGVQKTKKDIAKSEAEIELILMQKFRLEMQSTDDFRKMLIDDNNSLKNELKSVKDELLKVKKIIKEGLCNIATNCPNRQ